MNQRPQTSTLFPYTTLFRSLSLFTSSSAIWTVLSNEPVAYGLALSAYSANIGAHFRTKATSAAVALPRGISRSEEHTSELQSHSDLVCRLLLEKKNTLCDSA